MYKTIIDFPKYEVNEIGIVRRKNNGRIIAQQTYFGYKCVLLWKNGKSKWNKVHRLVATAFIANPKNKPQVNHIDEDKGNNAVENLEWCDARYNTHYGKISPVKKMTDARKKQVLQIENSGEIIAVFESATEAQRKTGIKQANISKCCLKREHFLTAGGYRWEFIK